MRAADRELAAGVHDDHAAAAHLAAGARSRRDGDDRRDRRGDLARPALDHRIGLQRVAGMRRHQRHALGEIHRRAAADGDDAVAALGFVHRQRVAHRGFGRILRRAVVDCDRHVAGQLILHLGPQAGGDHALVGDDQRPADAEQLQLRLEQLQRAEVELDAGEIGDERHESSCHPERGMALSFCASVREKKDMSDTLVLRAGTLPTRRPSQRRSPQPSSSIAASSCRVRRVRRDRRQHRQTIEETAPAPSSRSGTVACSPAS